MKKKYVIATGVVLCLLAAALYGWQQYNKPRQGVQNQRTAFTVDASALYNAFNHNEASANATYLGKVISVNGMVSSAATVGAVTNIMLKTGDDTGGFINCQMAKTIEDGALPATGALVTIKGKCVGYLMDVNLVDALLINE